MSSSIAPESGSAEAEKPSAQIIAFPARPKAAAAVTAAPVGAAPVDELDAQDRLKRALESLNAALTEQKAALAAWRGALSDLKTTTTGLGSSLQTFQSSLGGLNERVLAVREQAQSLERWADRVVTD